VEDWAASRGLDAGVYRGLSEVLAFFQTYLDTFDQVRLEPEEFIEFGDFVVVPNVARIRGATASKRSPGARWFSRFAVAK
jgi:hypothetical protein